MSPRKVETDPLLRTRLSLRLLPLAFWLALVAVAYSGLNDWLLDQQAREKGKWAQELSLVGRIQARQTGDWLQARQEVIGNIAGNVSAQLYVQTLRSKVPAASAGLPGNLTGAPAELPGVAQDAAPAAVAGDALPERMFLQNYLVAMAQQGGFVNPARAVDAIPANVEAAGQAGLALVTPEGEVLVSTSAMPDVAALMAAFPQKPGMGKVAMSQPIVQKTGGASVAFLSPLMAVQAAPDAAPLAWVVGVQPLNGLYNLLQPVAGIEETVRSSLLVKQGSGVTRYDAAQPPRSLQAGHDGESMEVQAVAQPGVMAGGRDASGVRMLAVAAPLDAAVAPGWQVVRYVSQKDALGSSTERLWGLRAAFLLTALALSLMVMLLWRHVSAQQTGRLLNEIRAHRSLLQLVTDRLPAGLMIVDSAQTITYANASAAREAKMEADAMVGKSLVAVLGYEASIPYQDVSELAIGKQTMVVQYIEWEEDGLARERKIEGVPLNSMPGLEGKAKPHALLVEQDLSAALQAKQAERKGLDKLLDTMVLLVDRRDPNAARQSQQVAGLAAKVAEAMELEPLEVQVAQTAGRLRNLGKLMIPQHVLTSDQPLNEHDRGLFDSAFSELLDVLADVPFQGPVLETLRQSREMADGSGPLGLKEEATLATARVLAVVNSFVAMTSDRSFRKGKSVDEALGVLQGEGGQVYSQPAVSALAHYLDNLGGRAAWSAATQD